MIVWVDASSRGLFVPEALTHEARGARFAPKIEHRGGRGYPPSSGLCGGDFGRVAACRGICDLGGIEEPGRLRPGEDVKQHAVGYAGYEVADVFATG